MGWVRQTALGAAIWLCMAVVRGRICRRACWSDEEKRKKEVERMRPLAWGVRKPARCVRRRAGSSVAMREGCNVHVGTLCRGGLG